MQAMESNPIPTGMIALHNKSERFSFSEQILIAGWHSS
jgi:hypothetical protein